MTWEPRPVPRVDPETERYWSAAADGRLLLRRCSDCELTYYYPRAHCPDCLRTEPVAWIEASGEGTVYSYTSTSIVEHWPDEALPLVLAYVELEEGPRMLTAIDGDPETVEIGLPVTVTFVPTEDPEVAVPVFEPA